MNTRVVIFILAASLAAAACKTGEFACPEPKKVRAHYKRTHAKKVRMTVPKPLPTAELSASGKSQRYPDGSFQKVYRQQMDVRAIKAIDVDEWDCPKPGKVNKRHEKAAEKAAKEKYKAQKEKLNRVREQRNE